MFWQRGTQRNREEGSHIPVCHQTSYPEGNRSLTSLGNSESYCRCSSVSPHSRWEGRELGYLYTSSCQSLTEGWSQGDTNFLVLLACAGEQSKLWGQEKPSDKETQVMAFGSQVSMRWKVQVMGYGWSWTTSRRGTLTASMLFLLTSLHPVLMSTFLTQSYRLDIPMWSLQMQCKLL